MYTKLSDVKLKTGEKMEIGVVLAPDEEYADRIIDLLSHKGEPWVGEVKKAIKGEITDLETRFYIGHLDGQVITNIMTAEYNRTGIFGHVYTRPEHRRKHACTLLMREQMEDFKRRGGGLLLLGTGYESPAYWIYHSYGFRSLSEGSGFMRFSTESNFEASHFAPVGARHDSPVRVVDVEWKHWPLMSVLTSVPGIAILRSVAFNMYGITSFEGGFLNFMNSLEENQSRKAKLLESSSGAVVGCITLGHDHRWTDKTYLLDIFLHPNFLPHYALLLNSLELPEGKIQCYVDARSPGEKIAALQQADFKREAVLKNQFAWGDEWFDVFIYSRFNRQEVEGGVSSP